MSGRIPEQVHWNDECHGIAAIPRFKPGLALRHLKGFEAIPSVEDLPLENVDRLALPVGLDVGGQLLELAVQHEWKNVRIRMELHHAPPIGLKLGCFTQGSVGRRSQQAAGVVMRASYSGHKYISTVQSEKIVVE
jgi:hypothetical protein